MSDENKNPYDLVDKENIENKENKNSQNFENIKNNFQEKTTNFLENIVRKIAKKAWLPDPKTGKPITDTETNETTKNNTWNTTLEQDIITQEKQEQEEKKNLNFENIMSGVWDVINKIGKKIWEKTWINLNAQEKQEPKQESKSTESTTTNEQIPENDIEKNNQEYLSK